MACDVVQNADLAAVVMQEGLAHICLVTSSMTVIRAKIDQVIPRKRKGNVQQHEKVGKVYHLKWMDIYHLLILMNAFSLGFSKIF